MAPNPKALLLQQTQKLKSSKKPKNSISPDSDSPGEFLGFSNHFHISPSLSLCFQLSHSLTHRESLAFNFGGWLALLRSSISSLSIVVFHYLRWVCSDPKCYFCFHSCYLVRFGFVYGLRPFNLILTLISFCMIWFLCVEVWRFLDSVNRSVCFLKLS